MHQSIFGRDDKDEKARKAAEKAERAAEKEAKKAEKKEEKKAKAEKSSRKDNKSVADESTSSPLAPRFSRDNYSLSTADMSEVSPRESLDQAISHTTSDSHMPASLGKESFMQKLTRKSSSGQFLQFSKAKSSLFSKRSSEAFGHEEPDDEAHGLSIKTDSPAPSPSIGTPKDKSSALSWSSIKRMGKRGDKAPSLHESITSETTGDEDDGGVEGIGHAA